MDATNQLNIFKSGLIAFALGLAASAHAYIDYVPMMSVGTWNNNSNVYMDEWKKSIGAAASAAAATTQPQTSTLVIAHDHSEVAAKLAANYPPEMRSEAERTFRDLLLGYHKIERQFGIATYDLAGATAAYIAGSWMAYNNADFPDANFPILANQMRRIISSSPAFARASSTDKSEMYDQLAIRGMYFATTRMALNAKPNEAIAKNIHQAAAQSLKDFCGVEPHQVHIGAQGLFIK